MTQGVLPFKYEKEKKESGMTGLGGLPVYLDLATVMGLGESIERHLHIKQQGWTDKQLIVSLMLLNLAGGDCVDDLQKLEGDDGLCKILRRIEQRGMKRRDRRELERRWRKEQVRAVPSQSSVFRYIAAFHDPEQEKLRVTGKAFIPAANEHLRGLVKVNSDMIAFVQGRTPQKVATLDQDATLAETTKRDALFSYQGYKAYQPLNTWWAEVCFIPNAIGHRKDAPVYRYLAIREAMGSMDLPGMESVQQSFPFPTLKMSSQRYKLFGLVTNMNWEGEKLIHWHRERCGKSEEAHSVMKEDLAGGKLPAGDFGENAAWWWIMLLAMNLNSAMKRLAIGKSWIPKRMKAMRFSFINIPGRIIEHSREFIIRLVKDHPAVDLLIEARRRIMALSWVPSG